MQMKIKQPLTVIDLFCGAGGLSWGMVQAGFDVVCAVDTNQAAMQTYQMYFGKHIMHADISGGAMQLPRSAVIIGGPPCQGFSSAGLRRVCDQRNSLVGLFAQVIKEMQPMAFVFENVEGFLTAENGERVLELLNPLIAIGYRIHLRKINAANYGVPQHRKRVIAIGGLGWNPSFPEPTHCAFGAPGAHLALGGSVLTPTLGDTLADLPPALTEPPGMPQGHFYRPLHAKELARAVALKPGQTMRDLPDELQHASYRRRAFRRVMDGTPTERRGGAPYGVRRLRSDEPSKAITSGANTEFLHPVEDRPLTIRECARLQTFPDDFVFYGSHSEQMQLIGNAVPPLLASIIASRLAEDMADPGPMTKEGTLLSFVPTLSSGYSPALKKVSERVCTRFLCCDMGI